LGWQKWFASQVSAPEQVVATAVHPVPCMPAMVYEMLQPWLLSQTDESTQVPAVQLRSTQLCELDEQYWQAPQTVLLQHA
jgi:hypothetical protein